MGCVLGVFVADQRRGAVGQGDDWTTGRRTRDLVLCISRYDGLDAHISTSTTAAPELSRLATAAERHRVVLATVRHELGTELVNRGGSLHSSTSMTRTHVHLLVSRSLYPLGRITGATWNQ
jgi:hypothetical protein